MSDIIPITPLPNAAATSADGLGCHAGKDQMLDAAAKAGKPTSGTLLPLDHKAGAWGEFDARGIRTWTRPKQSDDQLNVCAGCHSRGRPIADRVAIGAPLLDHRVVELAWSLPKSMRVRGGTGKWALRRVLDRYVPRALIDRPKTGFALPLAEWLRGPLRDWAESLLAPSALHPALAAAPIRAAWAEHLAGTRNHQHRLWCVLMFQAWVKKWG